MKEKPKKGKTTLRKNKGITGDSIEIMWEKLREGDGEAGIEDRDLVYNDNETDTVNPITNIRSDKWDLMLEEKIGEYEHKHKKTPKVETKTDEADEVTDAEFQGKTE